MKIFSILTVACGLMAASFANAGVDVDAAQVLMKKSACLTCHAVDKKKVAVSYKEVAKKYKGKADAEEKLVKHVTTHPHVEMDGKQVDHMVIKSDDPAAIRNVVQWILSQ